MRLAPLIGVSTSEMREANQAQPTPEGDPGQREMALGITYLQAIELAGGIPVVLPPLAQTAIDPLLERLSGVCLSGGPDLDPVAYGGRRHRQLGPTEPELDRFELALMQGADRIGLPVLGICRGAQAINVARGGSLRQHLPNHRQGLRGALTTHDVQLVPGSRLAAIIGGDRIEVNSFHHQAVRRLGRGLRGVGHAPDGVVEAIEDPSADFVIGVQWHAETLVQLPEQLALLREFVAAAARHSTRVPIQTRSVRAA